eukprot:jgi/Botrbrau1/23167/Bobra.0041s0018.1
MPKPTGISHGHPRQDIPPYRVPMTQPHHSFLHACTRDLVGPHEGPICSYGSPQTFSARPSDGRLRQQKYLLFLRVIYIANVLVAGYVGSLSFIATRSLASQFVFHGAFAQSDAFRLVGALWLGITLLSVIGIFKPILMTPVLLLQLWYKGTWLIAALIQASVDKNLGSVPPQMAVFFAVWIVVLPFAIPWRHFVAAGDAALRA